MSKLFKVNNPDADHIFYCYEDRSMALMKLTQEQIDNIDNVRVQCPDCKKRMDLIGWEAYG